MLVIKLTFLGWLYKEERSEKRDGTPYKQHKNVSQFNFENSKVGRIYHTKIDPCIP